MSQLIERLKSDHQMILKKLEELSRVNIILPEGHRKVLAVKEFFMSHLHAEDHEFYPLLKKEALQSPQLREILDMFDENMNEISLFAMEFFNKYLKGAVEFEFKRDFEILYHAFQKRIRREETILYEEYEKIKKRGGFDAGMV